MSFSAFVAWLAVALVGDGADSTVVRCGTLIDGRSSHPRANVQVVIEDGVITAVRNDDGETPDGARTIDLSDRTVLPGLIDVHVHPLIATDDYQVDHLKSSSAEKALFGLKVVQELLHAGWTTLRVAGDADVQYAPFAIRKAIEEGWFEGPRMVGAGHYLTVTGGGGDVNFFSPEQPIVADGLVVDGVDEVRRAVREEIKRGADWIKLLVTGAFMSAGDNPRDVHFSPEEVQVAVEEATRRNVPVMAHAHSAEGVKLAVRAGVRSIEHGTFLDAEGIELMLEHGTYLVPTLYVGEYYLEEKPKSFAQRKFVELTLRYREEYLRCISAAVDAGVKIGVGSDFVGFPPQYCVREIAMLTQVGLTPMQALQAATRVNAELLQKEDEIGTVEPGKQADLIAVTGDPLEDLAVLERVSFVMKGGRVVKDTD